MSKPKAKAKKSKPFEMTIGVIRAVCAAMPPDLPLAITSPDSVDYYRVGETVGEFARNLAGLNDDEKGLRIAREKGGQEYPVISLQLEERGLVIIHVDDGSYGEQLHIRLPDPE
jgi:hypothetical protein